MRLDGAGNVVDVAQSCIMGILNVTPDSFSDGGQFSAVESAVEQAVMMQANGAGIIDVGGESTRPGAQPVSVAQELERIVPVIQELNKALQIPISIDTTKPAVMQAAVAAGASIINDVNALQADGAVALAATLDVPVCLMHRQGDSATMQQAPHYTNVVAEVTGFLLERARICAAAGIQDIVLDVGFGFGKTYEHNVELFSALPVWQEQCHKLGYGSLVGVSRKRMVGEAMSNCGISHSKPSQRVTGSAVLAAMAVQAGATIVRVHDVAATRDAIAVMQAFGQSAP